MTSVLISGAGIAGPALALWLTRYGFDVTVVEKAPALRPGGQAVDFKGATHRTVLERMGILGDVRARQTGGEDGTVIDAAGRTLAVVPKEFSGGEIEIARGDLAQLLFDHTRDACTYVFDDTVTSLTETPTGVDVTFARSEPRTYDLVVGADGIHSTTRRLAFGPERDYVRHLGYYYALADVDVPGAPQMYNEPGRMASLGGGKAPAFFVFASAPLSYDRFDSEQQKRIVAEAYRGGGWRIPELLDQLPEAREFYLDSISRVTTDRYSAGRVVLLGDAAYGNTLGGYGTGLAVVGAYVLAGELHRAGGDHRRAFAEYEAKFRGYAKVSQQISAGRLLAPKTRLGMRGRNALFSVSALLTPLLNLTERLATDDTLEDYDVRPQPA
ncbi:FAD-dependent monooxygenase [Symbioplanes lichenis]|uniref:FAD-dependent monooxygenase n=1 Tax=Symbioplanes lichenis TaxID=1629072 RepID=UPI002739DEB4|nr:FAD-dependent monooxygenase [Actinoplanes lichenis]